MVPYREDLSLYFYATTFLCFTSLQAKSSRPQCWSPILGGPQTLSESQLKTSNWNLRPSGWPLDLTAGLSDPLAGLSDPQTLYSVGYMPNVE